MPFFRPSLPPHQTALAMVGAKPGQRVVFLGAAAPGLAGEVGRVTGLNGHTLVVAEGTDAGVAVARGAARAGALVEFVDRSLFLDPPDLPGDFDVAVVTADGWSGLGSDVRARVVHTAFRALRPGGRLVLILDSGRRPRFGQPPLVDRALVDDGLALLTAAGSRAVRNLADVPGASYLEGVKPRAT